MPVPKEQHLTLTIELPQYTATGALKDTGRVVEHLAELGEMFKVKAVSIQPRAPR